MGGGGRKLAGSMQIDRRFMFMKKKSLGGCLPLPRGYIHVYDHNIQTSSSLKSLGQSKPKFVEHRWEMTEMATMDTNSKNPYKSYSSEPEDL